MPLYRLERQSLKETIPPGNYMYDPPNGLPRITIRIDGETTPEELAEGVRKELRQRGGDTVVRSVGLLGDSE